MALSQLAVEVFCSYAHEDELYHQQLETHVSVLERQGLISLWHDRQILPGANWAEAIDEHLETASIILLLISANFTASDYCYGIEMARALERHNANEARVIPIVVRPCDWQQLPVASLQALPMDAKPISTYRSVDDAWTQVAAGLRRVIEDLSLLPASAPRTALPKIWMIPYPRNPFFLGRDELLSQIHSQLQAGQATALSQPQAISGLGGIGKTQVAIEYAYRYFQEYQMILWAHAESIDTLNTSYARFATELNLPEQKAEEQEILIKAMKTWLRDHRNWLLILDNADELALLRDFLPTVVGGHLLITTRASAIGPLARRIEVKTFTEEQGALFLLRRASILAPDDPLSQASEQDQQVARTISNELGGLPLALDQAGAYLEQTGLGPREYQQIYQDRRADLLRERGGRIADHDDYPEPVARTWSLCFAQVEQKNPVASDVLRLCAFLSANAIPLALITAGTQPVAQNTFILGQAIETLRAYSLVNYASATRTLSLHRLVQVVVRDSLPQQKQKLWMERVVITVALTFPDPEDVSQWSTCEQWLPHALECAAFISHHEFTFSEATQLLTKSGSYLLARAEYMQAESLLRQALAIRERELGFTHLDTASSLDLLGWLYQRQGKYKEAEYLLQRALAIREQTLGPTHPDIVQSLSKLGHFFYGRQGKYEEAERLLQRALAICEQALGPTHPDTAFSLQHLGWIYSLYAKHKEAERVFQRALTINQQIHGLTHPSTIANIEALGFIYTKQAKYREAEPLLQEALAACEQLLGPIHSETIQALINLGWLYWCQARYEEAEQLFQRALAAYEQLLNSFHPDTAQIWLCLSMVYSDQGRYKEAEALCQQAIAIYEQVYGFASEEIGIALGVYALLLLKRWRIIKAAQIGIRVLKALGVRVTLLHIALIMRIYIKRVSATFRIR